MLVYTSKSKVPIDEILLKNILTKCNQNNRRDNITGFLAARAGYFLQLLEGSEIDVMACYERIKLDPRHRQITLQGTASITSRIMPNWKMGFVEKSVDSSVAEQLLDLFELGRAGKPYTSNLPLEAMLRSFSKDAKIIVL